MKVQSKLMQNNGTRRKLRSGFTLVELLVVIAIIGVLEIMLFVKPSQ